MDPNNQTPVAVPTVNSNPGIALGVVSLILGCVPFMGLIGLILGLVAKGQSKRANLPNGVAVAGIVISTINLILALLFAALITFGVVKLVQKCHQLGAGTHVDNGVTYTCNTSGYGWSHNTNSD